MQKCDLRSVPLECWSNTPANRRSVHLKNKADDSPGGCELWVSIATKAAFGGKRTSRETESVDLRELTAPDRQAAVRLWGDAGLTRPWNDPVADFDRALAGAQSAILGLFDDGTLAGTVMVGDDGHRGWVYYLAVDVMHRRCGAGGALIAAAENWTLLHGVAKVNLMVRHPNQAALGFYANLGYDDDDVAVLSRRLSKSGQ